MPGNQEYFDALLRHQIGLLRLSGSVRNEVLAILDATESDLRQQLLRRLERISAGAFLSEATNERIRVLMSFIADIRNTAWDRIDQLWQERAAEIAENEPQFTAKAASLAVPVVVDFEFPTAERLEQIVKAQPFHGKVLAEWSAGVRANDLARIEQQIKIGLTAGESVQEIVRRITGTSVLRGTDGITQLSRNEAEALTRTVINHVSNSARSAFFEANRKIFPYERFVATLDSRTTVLCASLDGRRFPVGKGPIPPLHFRCRSIRVAEIDGGAIGDRPAKFYARADLRGLTPRARREKVADMIGQLPATTTYDQFLRRQSIEFQEDVLGKTKAALFRKGGLKLDRFLDRAGNELSLDQLRKIEAAAFKKAGLL